VRKSLVAALIAYAETSLRPRARRFLGGLSFDELQFIAGFFGSWIVEAHAGSGLPPLMGVRPGGGSGLPASDLEHKLILVHEYLCHTGSLRFAAKANRAALNQRSEDQSIGAGLI
jgi:hypothetical protein